MLHYVYIIQSEADGTYYKGYSADPYQRLEYHNAGKSRYTSKKTPWKLVFIRAFEEKKDALIEEKRIKRVNQEYLKWMIGQPYNLLND